MSSARRLARRGPRRCPREYSRRARAVCLNETASHPTLESGPRRFFGCWSDGGYRPRARSATGRCFGGLSPCQISSGQISSGSVSSSTVRSGGSAPEESRAPSEPGWVPLTPPGGSRTHNAPPYSFALSSLFLAIITTLLFYIVTKEFFKGLFIMVHFLSV